MRRRTGVKMTVELMGRVFELREAGHKWHTIGLIVGLNATVVQRKYRSALERGFEGVTGPRRTKCNQ